MTVWLKTWKDEIVSTTAILGVLIGIIGFTLTSYQLWRTTDTLRASNSYQIQKDARDLVEKLLTDPRFREALNASTISAENRALVLNNLWSMFNFYLSVYRQAEAGGLASEFIFILQG